VCKREFDFLTGKEYPKEYTFSIALVKNISKIRARKRTPQKAKRIPLIIKTYSLKTN
jgi:hypothetical protein